MDSGADLHSYQPTAEDMMRIASCDLFIYTGGVSSQWARDALKGAVNPDMIVIDLLEALGDRAKEETLVEGMQDAHGHEGHDHEEDRHEEEELDEHVWLSLRNASFLCGVIGEALEKADPSNKDVYAANTAAYQEKLGELDRQYQETADAAKVRTLLFGDRFPFLYLAEDYGLSYYAAFSGCSAETEASFETVAFLAAKADEIPVSCVLTIDGSDKRIAETIVRSTKNQDQKILTLNSMQSIAGKQAEEGVTYLSVMEENLPVLIYVHGGPGQSMMPFAGWLNNKIDFATVVYYDQRGTGRTQLRSKSTAETITFEQLLDDLKETIRIMKEKYHKTIHKIAKDFIEENIRKYPVDQPKVKRQINTIFYDDLLHRSWRLMKRKLRGFYMRVNVAYKQQDFINRNIEQLEQDVYELSEKLDGVEGITKE